MKCPLTYEEVPGDEKFSVRGLTRLSKRLKTLADLPFDREEVRHQAALPPGKMSIQGVQPKLSAVLNTRNSTFTVVDQKGKYILKPPTNYPELPQNEDLTMHLAKEVDIEVPLHGLVYAKDKSLVYFIQRFD